MDRNYKSGDLVVYSKEKYGTHPGARAHDVHPAPLGDSYRYVVDKYWIVDEVRADGRLVLRTPGGKLHEIDAADLALRKLTLREHMWLRLFDRERLDALLKPRDG